MESNDQQSSLDQQSVPHEHTQHNHLLFLSLCAVLLFGLGVFGGYLLWGNKPIESQHIRETIISPTNLQPSPTDLVPVLSNEALEARIPADWKYQVSNVCSVSIPIPPKKEPYYTTKFPFGGAADDNNRYWLLRDRNDNGFLFFKHSVFAIYDFETPPQFGNGYTSGLVRVFCSPNIERLTTVDLVNKLEEEIEKEGRSLSVVSKREISKWGQSVYAVVVDGFQGSTVNDNSERYMYASNKMIYFIDGISESDNKIVRETTKQILDNIRF